MNKTIIAFLAVLVLLVGGLYFIKDTPLGASSGTFHSNFQEFAGGFNIGASGTTINKYKCYTNTSYNPGAVSSSTIADALAFETSGATAGDIVFASIATTTSASQWYVTARVTAGSGATNATTTLYLKGLDGASVNLTTTTAKVCILN